MKECEILKIYGTDYKDMTKRLLKLPAVPKPDDSADAVAIALCHARSHTSRLQSAEAAKPGSGRYEVKK